MKRAGVHLIIGMALAAVTFLAAAQASGFGSAFRGAALGSLLDGQDGARKGAIIGGAAGLIRGANEASRRKAEQEARERQQAERQRLAQQQQEADIVRLKAQQAAQAATAGAGPDASLITEIQKSLIRLGFDPGDVNGNAGPSTVEAIKQYQAKKGLLEDGNPSQPLLTHMLKNGG